MATIPDDILAAEASAIFASNDLVIVAIKQALERGAAIASPWQPIATAPRDGTIIIMTTGDATGTGRWRQVASRDTLNDIDGVAQIRPEYGWHSVSDKRLNKVTITHWMPLPPLPATEA